jgi:predicted DNA-binding protein YlxM (UPF0122 family)
MDEKKFKHTYKPPACTQQPWKFLIPAEIREDTLRKIRQETVEAYGYSMDECPKRMVCFTKECIGRPLPWKSETAKPYLDKLSKTHSIKNEDLYINNCGGCPIAKTCTSSCPQVNDWIKRSESIEPKLVYQKSLEQHVDKTPQQFEDGPPTFSDLKIPWDSLPDRKASVIKKYLFQQKDFLTIANELDLNNQARAKYEFYSALTRLSEVAVMRKFIEEKDTELDQKQLDILNAIYQDGKTLTEISEQYSISKQAVQQLVSRIIDKYRIKWSIFVRKQGGKVIYNVPEILK